MQQVSFSEDESTPQEEYISIERDDSTGPYISPQYVKYSCEDGGMETKHPVAYISGGKIAVSAYIDTNCPNDIFIRGMADLGNGIQMKFPWMIPARESNGQGADLLYQGTSRRAFTPNQIRYFPDFDIEWQWAHINTENNRPNDQTEWITFGTSSNPMYVTLRDFSLVNDFPKPTYFHTLLKLTCKAANNVSTDDLAIDKIWQTVKTLNNDSADTGESLFYYDSFGCGNVTTKDLLEFKDGQCGAWVHFLIDCLKVQGLSHSTLIEDFVLIRAPKSMFSDDYLMFIENWAFDLGAYSNTTQGFDWEMITDVSVPEGFDYVGIPKQANFPDAWMNGDQYNWEYSDFTNMRGLDGQGVNAYPESIFDRHFVANISGNLLDPSYGAEYSSSLSDFETESVAAYGVIRDVIVNEADFDFNGDGEPEDFNGNNLIDEFLIIKVFFVNTNKKITNPITFKFNG